MTNFNLSQVNLVYPYNRLTNAYYLENLNTKMKYIIECISPQCLKTKAVSDFIQVCIDCDPSSLKLLLQEVTNKEVLTYLILSGDIDTSDMPHNLTIARLYKILGLTYEEF